MRLVLAVIAFIGLCFNTALAEDQNSQKKKFFNPDIGANFLGLYQNSKAGNVANSDRRNGFSLQEAELQLTSDVDVYFRAVVLLSVSKPTPQSGSYEVSPEEVFAETISLPLTTLKVGKFKAAFGRHNLLHTHARPFIDAPLIHESVLGDEGLNEVGLSAAFLAPLPWFSEVTMQGFGGDSPPLLKSSHPNQLSGLIHLKNFWELSEPLTLEWGLSGVTGPNANDSSSRALGTDITMKWRPLMGGKYRAVWWSTEFISAKIRGNVPEKTDGVGTWVQVQFAERWWVQGRFDSLGYDESFWKLDRWRVSALVGFFPSEFSGIRLQYSRSAGKLAQLDHKIALQMNFSIGAHPAHGY